WTHFIDPETGEIVKTIALRPYYWFQSFAIFPDKHDAVITLDEINIGTAEPDRVIDLNDFVSDKDNIDANIKLSVVEMPANVHALAAGEADAPAVITLEGKNLTVSPKAEGQHFFTLAAESNGRTVSKTVTVNVTQGVSGINSSELSGESVVCDGQRVTITGFNGHDFVVYDLNGLQLASFHVDADNFIFDFGMHSGVYIVSSDNGLSTKVLIK
ncbi:MAG: T9SS type A sorting domain-containing protein, partial [Muribaculaceae bacterium]|nr:T9SS type A sorting domain-containing protein [Muribaculaceae bacterium]